MATRWYYKEVLSNAFIVKGKAAPFEQLEGNRGVLVLDTEKDADLIAALDEAAANQRGGIVRLSEAGYIEKKNNPPPPPLNARSRQSDEIRVMPRDLSPHKVAEAAAGKPNGAQIAQIPKGIDGLPLLDAKGLRLDGPTLEEYREAGYKGAYPPATYAARTVPRWKEAGFSSQAAYKSEMEARMGGEPVLPPSMTPPVTAPPSPTPTEKKEQASTEEAPKQSTPATSAPGGFRPRTGKPNLPKTDKEAEKPEQNAPDNNKTA